MATQTPLAQAQLVKDDQRGRSSLHKRILVLMTCVGMVVVAGTQYYSSARFLSPTIPLLSKDDFMSAGVVEFRSTGNSQNQMNKDSIADDGQKDEVAGTGSEDAPLDYNGTPLHVVFSTSCSDQMHWESFVFFYHAFKVRQPGTVTRIASGCDDREAQAAKEFQQQSIRTMSDRFYLHLTPDFSKQRLFEKGGYKYMNKPFGLRDWLENEMQMHADNRQKGIEDGVVILMDPDMILLRPILHDYTNEDVVWVEENPATRVVKHGFPMAQQDGYLDNKWMHINGTFVTGDPNLEKPKDKFGPLHWNTGPPYLATVKDMYGISLLWTDYAPRVDHINPGLFAEMQGFIWATYKLNLPHTLIKSLVVSNPTAPHREGWSYVDNLPDDEVCVPSIKKKRLPVGLHYCKRYALGPDFFFSKYRLKKNILNCEKNLLLPPPKDIHTQYDYFIGPPPEDAQPRRKPEKKTFSTKQAKREGFMLCGMIDAVNEAAAYYKTRNCGGKGNFNKVYTIKNDPSKY